MRNQQLTLKSRYMAKGADLRELSEIAKNDEIQIELIVRTMVYTLYTLLSLLTIIAMTYICNSTTLQQ